MAKKNFHLECGHLGLLLSLCGVVLRETGTEIDLLLLSLEQGVFLTAVYTINVLLVYMLLTKVTRKDKVKDVSCQLCRALV